MSRSLTKKTETGHKHKILRIKPNCPGTAKLYSNHGPHFKGDSGIDVYCLRDEIILCGETLLLDLGIQCEMLDATNNGQSFYLHPRSSLSKTPLIMANSAGVIDSGYRGTLKAAVKYVPTTVDLQNMLYDAAIENKEPIIPSYLIKKGTRLFQICAPNLDPIVVELVDTLSPSDRGEGGFGSTGK